MIFSERENAMALENRKEFYRLHSDLCKTLAHAKRQEILDIIRGQTVTVTELVEKTGIPQANVSQHLAVLKSKGVIALRREGARACYYIANPKILEAFDIISQVLLDSLESQNRTVRKVVKRNA